MRRVSIAVAMVLAWTAPSSAQDALRGKRFYLDTARLTGASVSCVDCHRALPGLFGIGSAANNPAIIANALNSVPQMAPLRGRLAAADIADIAAYIGNSGVPSPMLRVSTRNAAGTESMDRLDFGAVLPGETSARGMIRLANDGALSLLLTSNVRIVGPQAAQYALIDSSCTTALAAGQLCEAGITFRPAPGSVGLQSAAAQVDHDWVGGTAAVALLGTAETSAANPPVGASGGGGTLALWWLAIIASAAAVRGRSRARRHWLPLYRRW